MTKEELEMRKLEQDIKFQGELHAAKLSQEQAIVERIKQETDRLKSESLKFEAERKAQQLAYEQSQLFKDYTKLTLEREQEKRAMELSADYHHSRIDIRGAIDADQARYVIGCLASMHRMNPSCDIEICISSHGGSVVDGMAIYDYIQGIRAAGHKVTTEGLGMTASMGGVLLQAGDVRVMGRNAFLLIHQASGMSFGSSFEIKDRLVLMEKMESRITDIYVSRAKGKISREEFSEKWNRTDWWLNAEEALALGFVDELK